MRPGVRSARILRRRSSDSAVRFTNLCVASSERCVKACCSVIFISSRIILRVSNDKVSCEVQMLLAAG